MMRNIVTVFLMAATVALAFPAIAQQQLQVARSQIAAGRTADARKIAAAEAARGSELARLMEAELTPRGDSAALALEKIARQGGHGLASAHAGERMGDILFAAGRWEDALKWWEFAAGLMAEPGDRQRLAIKSARAELARGQRKQAIDKLGAVANSADAPLAGEARFWRGMAFEKQGKTREAAEDYLASYTTPGNRLSLAALQRLHVFYGSSDGKNSADWRQRWNSASSGTVFDNRFLPSVSTSSGSSSSGWTIQLGAFSTRQRASDHAARIKRLGLTPVIEPPSSDKLYRVRIEGIPSEREMKRISALLKKNRLDFHVIRPGK
jgi:tetratricopeptide (TPR) repeat protein